MKTLNNLTMAEILSVDCFWLDDERLDEDDLFDLAVKNKDELDKFQYSIEIHPDGSKYIAIW